MQRRGLADARPGTSSGHTRPRSLLLGVALVAVLFSAASRADGAGVVPRIDLYTSIGCGYCTALRAYLDARGITYVEHNINETLETQAAFYAMGGQGVPLAVIGGRMILGFRPFKIEQALDEARRQAAGS